MEFSQPGWRRLSMMLVGVNTAATVGALALRPVVTDIAVSEGAADLLPTGPPTEVLSLPFAAAAHLILRRVPNRVGLVLHLIGLCFALPSLALHFTIVDQTRWHLGLIGDLAGNWVGNLWLPALIFLIVFLPLLFPGGDPPSRGWRWVGWAGTTVLGFGFVSVTQQTVAGSELMTGPEWIGLIGLLLVSAVGACASVVFRYRRAGVTERQQIKGVAFTLAVVGTLVSILLAMGENQILPIAVVQTLFFVAIVSVPVAIALAIARYRLYDIDRIISRTVAYALVVATVALVYAVPVLLIPNLIGQSSDLVVAASTLGAAAIFNPARRSIQRGVDRYFNRARYDSLREVENFGSTLSNRIDTLTISDQLGSVLSRTVQPRTLTVWIR